MLCSRWIPGSPGSWERLSSWIKQLAEAERTLESRRRSAAEALRKRQESETKIENYRRLVERQQARTDQLHGQREIQAAMVEMDLARSVLAKEENDWAQAGDNVIAQDAASRAAEEKLDEQRAGQVEAREGLSQRMAAAQAERETGPSRARCLGCRGRARPAPAIRATPLGPSRAGGGPAGRGGVWRLLHHRAAQPSQPDSLRRAHRLVRELRCHPLLRGRPGCLIEPCLHRSGG